VIICATRRCVLRIYYRSKTVVFVPAFLSIRNQQVDPDKNPRQNWCGFGRFLAMILGYARISTGLQNLGSQRDALAGVGAERIFADTISGTARSRPHLERMMQEIREGDVIVVTKYDRLARSLKNLLEIVDQIKLRGAGFRSLAEDIDTTTPAGCLVFHVFASIARFERERISERTKEGLDAARRRGRIGGRPPALSSTQKVDCSCIPWSSLLRGP
jgi:DNA invertase Pin-like site-specific DNA recombinase